MLLVLASLMSRMFKATSFFFFVGNYLTQGKCALRFSEGLTKDRLFICPRPRTISSNCLDISMSMPALETGFPRFVLRLSLRCGWTDRFLLFFT